MCQHHRPTKQFPLNDYIAAIFVPYDVRLLNSPCWCRRIVTPLLLLPESEWKTCVKPPLQSFAWSLFNRLVSCKYSISDFNSFNWENTLLFLTGWFKPLTFQFINLESALSEPLSNAIKLTFHTVPLPHLCDLLVVVLKILQHRFPELDDRVKIQKK